MNRQPNTDSNEYKFSKDWFSNNIPRWEKHFKKLIKTANQKPLNALELGSFEGRSAIWTLENILIHPKSHITCVDNYGNIPESRKSIQTSAKKRFIENTSKFSDKVTLIVKDTRDALKSPEVLNKLYDFIYIDASRHSKNVLEDAILALPLLKVGGYMIFDDYTSSKEHDYVCPKKGIDTFLDIFHDELKVENTSWQVIVKKKTPKKSPKACHSELFSRIKTDK